jgi:hypothetical protein
LPLYPETPDPPSTPSTPENPDGPIGPEYPLVPLVPLDPAIAVEAAWLHLAILAADGGRHVRALFGRSRPIPGVARLLRIAALPRSLRPLVATVARITGRRLEAEALVKTGPRDAAEVAALAAARIDLAARFAGLVATCVT